MDQLDALFRGILPLLAGFLVGRLAFKLGKIATVTLIVALVTLAATGALMPVKEMVIEQSRPTMSLIVGLFKQAYVVVPGVLVGVLLGILVSDLRRPKRT